MPSLFQIPYAYVNFSTLLTALRQTEYFYLPHYVADAIFMHIQIQMLLKEGRRDNVIFCSWFTLARKIQPVSYLYRVFKSCWVYFHVTTLIKLDITTIECALLQGVPTNYMSVYKLLTLLRASSVAKWRIRRCEKDCVVQLKRRYFFRLVGLNKITKIIS